MCSRCGAGVQQVWSRCAAEAAAAATAAFSSGPIYIEEIPQMLKTKMAGKIFAEDSTLALFGRSKLKHYSGRLSISLVTRIYVRYTIGVHIQGSERSLAGMKEWRYR